MAVTINGSTGIDKVQDDSVDIADLSATGTASSSTYLRGDNTWATAGGATSIDGLSDATVYNTTTIGLGSGALDSMSSGNGRNTAVGYNALTANTSGYNNTAVGHLAGTSITDGYQNTLLGDRTGTALTTGDNNTALGQHALKTATTGNNNTAVGFDCMALTTTGNPNTAVGAYCLDAMTSGSNNTAIGYQAMSSLTDGGNNVAVGHNSLTALTTHSYCTAVGVAALESNTTAHGNTAVGYKASISNTTGVDNASFGAEAGYNVTTGSYNTCIGVKAGKHHTVLTTGDQNVLIGSYTGVTSGGTDEANGFGHGIQAAGGYTTLGNDSADIRASHGSTSWSTVSDERYKKDIVDSTTGLNFINALRPRTFKYRNLGELPNTFFAYKEGSEKVFKNSYTNHGFIAQEVKAAIDADSSIKDGFRLWDDREDGSQEVAEAALIPVLVKAIQELSAKNDALEARITTLEG